MAWDLVQTDMIAGWTDMLVMERTIAEARPGPNISILLHSNQLRGSTWWSVLDTMLSSPMAVKNSPSGLAH